MTPDHTVILTIPYEYMTCEAYPLLVLVQALVCAKGEEH